ncbi:BMP family ABC transporter substrate-binding protein [Kitasatospora xanthocidica]|uniref:BMP family ABC transporter substrate-binding protein n=1 Tax=Kitasatospora xanthocidica TaxID=83382 RepID=UPI001672A01C|nr:BMP family ABC transporter substrate-binding protein [Kitasatospora xanthocidica]
MTLHLTRRHRWVLGLTAALAVTGVGVGILLANGSDGEAVPAAAVSPSNISGLRTACLTGDAAEAASRTDTSIIWAALQDAARQRQLNVQQLLVPAATTDQALPYLAGLSAQHCDLVVSIGPAFTQASKAAAADNPRTRFIAVATDGQPAVDGVVTITGSDNEKASEIRRRALDLPATGK